LACASILSSVFPIFQILKKSSSSICFLFLGGDAGVADTLASTHLGVRQYFFPKIILYVSGDDMEALSILNLYDKVTELDNIHSQSFIIFSIFQVKRCSTSSRVAFFA
jgi:hypothetical protein